ncbi:MAG: DUF6056 family protein [Paludibacteraceae bacterium]|nr:DUF6056 family protein [Paludibacteraceae bacterium]
MKNYKKICFFCLLLVFAVLFFVLSYNTFFLSDDYAMSYDMNGTPIESIGQISQAVYTFYFNWGGGILGTFNQFLFCGLFPDKICFDIVNTLMFVVFLFLCTICAVNDKSQRLLSLAIIFVFGWLLLPMQNETMFWIVGSTAYLWTTVQAIAFISIFFYFKNRNNSNLIIALLGVASFFLASSHLIAALSISGALIFYYLVFHRDELNKTIVVMSIMYGFGTAIITFAPGNFARQATLENGHFLNVYAMIRSFLDLKIFYLLLIASIAYLIYNKSAFVNFVKNNQFLLWTLGFSIFAFCIVFHPSTRAAFFTETVSLILFVKILLELCSKKVCSIFAVCLCLICCVDYCYAYKDIIKQKQNNDLFLQQLIADNGVTCFETVPNKHRMANPVRYEHWTYHALKLKYGFAMVSIKPYVYCDIQDESVFSKENKLDGCEYAYQIDERIVLRIPHTNVSFNKVECNVQYTMPKVWHRDLRSKMHLFKYERQTNYIAEKPDYTDAHYNYFIFGPVGNKQEIITFVNCSF